MLKGKYARICFRFWISRSFVPNCSTKRDEACVLFLFVGLWTNQWRTDRLT